MEAYRGEALRGVIVMEPAEQVVGEFRFSVSLHGGRLATVTVPLSRQNVDRLKQLIALQLEPLVLDSIDEGPDAP